MVALTLTNPATILSFAALFASIGAGTGGAERRGRRRRRACSWARSRGGRSSTGVVARLRARMTPRAIRWLNVASAVIIGGFGVAAIVLGLTAADGAMPERWRLGSPATPSRPRPRSAAALFDWDGTIVDTLPLIYRANMVVLGELGITLSREWFRERYTPDWRASYRELGVPEDRWDAVAARWAEEMRAGRPRALPWARGALRRLARHGVRLGLVTASTRGVVEPSLRRLDLEGVFETAYFADDVVDGSRTPRRCCAHWPTSAWRPPTRSTSATRPSTSDGIGRRDAVRGGRRARRARPRSGPRAMERVWPDVGAWVDDLLGRRRPDR